MAEHESPTSTVSPLINAEELRPRLGHRSLKLLDVRGTWSTPARSIAEDYRAGHLPGAVFLDWTKEFLEQGVPLNLASVAPDDQAAASFASLGVDDGDMVVVYDDNHHMFAGRIWWAMRHWGFDNVRVLNGGWRHWSAQGLPTSTDVPRGTRGSFRPQRNGALRVSLDEFIAARTEACVLDGRGPAGYAGKPEDRRSGHVPGALSVPYSALIDDATGLFLDDTGLRTQFDERAPGWADRRIIASCGAGYSATVAMLALSKLGVESSLFDGSFAAWKQDPTRPVEQGLGPTVPR